MGELGRLRLLYTVRDSFSGEFLMRKYEDYDYFNVVYDDESLTRSIFSTAVFLASLRHSSPMTLYKATI